MLEIVTIVGARPQFIKAATVSRAISAKSDLVQERIVHTGQHYDANMSQVFFDELDIPRPAVNLGIGGGPHGAMTGRQLEGVESVLMESRPDWVLVYGDTNSTLAGALAAAKLRIPVAHVESGLRSFNRGMPEEINRIAVDHVSNLLFTPTSLATSNLLAEGVADSWIRQVGDVMYDAAMFYRHRSRAPEWLDELIAPGAPFILCTLHRAENTDDPGRLSAIWNGLAESETPVVLPAHPRTQQALRDVLAKNVNHVHVVDPVSYLEMTCLLQRCTSVVTDSGGLQKEAYFHGKPCLTVREETEWVELLDIGANRLVAAVAVEIATAINQEPGDLESGQLFGDGKAAIRIVDNLLSLTGSSIV